MALNFHGHILPGDGKKLLAVIDPNPEATDGYVDWTETVLAKINIHHDLAHWCFYRLQLCPQNHWGSADSVVLRTALRWLVVAIYSNWEIVVSHLPVRTVEAAIKEFHAMCDISKEYPVMVWEYYDENSPSEWVQRILANLPPVESINHFYELPHMRNRFIDIQNGDYCGSLDEEAARACRRALADRNRRLNNAAKGVSRGNKRREI